VVLEEEPVKGSRACGPVTCTRYGDSVRWRSGIERSSSLISGKQNEDISGAHGAHIKSSSLILDLMSLVDYSIYK
jgi:hypothetical protein